MYLRYSPANNEAKTWQYHSSDFPSRDAEDIEEVLGYTFDEFQMVLLKGGIKARRALLWTYLRKDAPGLKFNDVSFLAGELVLEFDSREQAVLRQKVQESDEMSDADKETVLSLLSDTEDEGDPKE